MGRLIDEEKFKENLVKCKGLGRKTCELVCEALNNTPTAGIANKRDDRREGLINNLLKM